STGTASQFGGLIVGFSFFLIVSALLLTAMLFRFGLEQRGEELGTLLALGWPAAQVRRLFLRESLALAGVGAVLGVAGGLAYGRAVLWGLTSLWSDAVAGAGLEFHAGSASVAMGALASVAMARVTLSFTLRRALRRPARELLNEGLVERPAPGTRPGRLGWVLAAGCLAAGLGLAGVSAGLSDSARPGAFFGAGACLLLGGLTVLHAAWRRPRHRLATCLASLAWRAPARQPRRSLATVALLASAVFLIVAVAANRLDASRNARSRPAGTGGFALWAESALPVLPDLNTPSGREEAGLHTPAPGGVAVVPLRVRDGDDASCLNLNRAQRPRLLGVHPEDLAGRGAFTFAALARDLNITNGWLALATGARPGADGVREVPAIGDAASIQWGLGRKIGDTLDYQDEHGRPFRLRLVGAVAPSILQGS
ncbi:MAG: FtsX-like permease family protein, partial [Verrucomicrobiota bacterium]